MRRFVVVSLALVITLWLLTTAASARGIETWPYERLFKEADLVVIAKATSAAVCEDKTTDNLWKAEFLGTNTTFAVKSVLKGKPPDNPLKVLHFKLKKGVRIEDGPLLVTFRSAPFELKLKEGRVGLGVPDYLLFLKVRKDGRYEPVSGRVDPVLSVRELYAPLSNKLGG